MNILNMHMNMRFKSYSPFLGSPEATPEVLAVGGNEWLWRKLSFNFGVRRGMLSIFDDYSRAALAPLARINYKLTPN